jgi:hypothetical protein
MPRALEVGVRKAMGAGQALREALTAGPFRVAAEDTAGDVRAVELDGIRCGF